MKTVEFQVAARDDSGKGANRARRRAGLVPGIIYGPKRSPAMVAFNARDFDREISHLGASQLVRLKSADAGLGEKVVLLRDLQLHPVTSAPLHVDFYEVDMDAEVQVPVALHFEGKAVGIVKGGILQPIRRELEVTCLPGNIPETIEIDVTALDIGDSIHLSDIALPAGVVVESDADFTVVTVASPSVEAAPETTEDEVDAPAAEADADDSAAAKEGEDS